MKVALYGAGVWGRIALLQYGIDNVECFIDNSETKQNTVIEGIRVISFKEFIRRGIKTHIVVTTKYRDEIVDQIESEGIKDYSIWSNIDRRIYPIDELIVNPYLDGGEYIDNSVEAIVLRIPIINRNTEALYGEKKIFDEIEIETVNRCNGHCSFCPVSVGNDKRDLKKMTDTLFNRIIEQLADMEYEGKICLHSNNEPFVDEKIVERCKLVKQKIPKAHNFLFSNGTLITMENFVKIIPHLDELVIDDYSQDLTLHDNINEICSYCNEHVELKKKVTVVMRRIDEELTTRGGDAPNRRICDSTIIQEAKCDFPFKQMVVRPDGKLSLCCNDPYGSMTLGDLNKETILEAWNSDRYNSVREQIMNGRRNLAHCKYCDTFRI